jgi:hypothetical protein
MVSHHGSLRACTQTPFSLKATRAKARFQKKKFINQLSSEEQQYL